MFQELVSAACSCHAMRLHVKLMLVHVMRVHHEACARILAFLAEIFHSTLACNGLIEYKYLKVIDLCSNIYIHKWQMAEKYT